MKKLIQLLTPTFVKQLDKLLLEKYPFLWSKRLAHVLFFGLLILTFNVVLCSFYPITVYSYTQIWVFTWILSVPSVLFLLIWTFFQYKYDLAWDHSRIGWGYYFKTGLSYTLTCIFCLMLVVLPVTIYQNRVTNFYANSLSIPADEDDDHSQRIASTYLDRYYSRYEDLSKIKKGSEHYIKIRQDLLDKLFGRLDYFSEEHDIDTIVKPEIEEFYETDPFLGLRQFGDSTDRYPGVHLWLVNLGDVKKESPKGDYVEGTITMFSPRKYYELNKELVLKEFDSSQYSFKEFFNSEHLPGVNFPQTVQGYRYDWKTILFNPVYHIETQILRVYDKQPVKVIDDRRLNTSYQKLVFLTDLPGLGKSYESYYIGAKVRGNEKLFEPSEFYDLKRLEYLLHKRFNVESLEHLDSEYVSDNIAQFQQFGQLVGDLEADEGNTFVRYDDDDTIMGGFATIYICSAILALLILTVRLLNFRLLVISVISLAITSFLIFVPLLGFNVHLYESGAFLFLSCVFAALIGAVIWVNVAKSISKFMIISALAGLIVLPLITLFYFFVVIQSMGFADYEEKNDFALVLGSILSVIFILGHIPLIARTIHKAYYLPKR